jgi:predicted ATPase
VTFSSLQLDRWRQFESVDIEFHPRLTILTGANGAGKTTLLNILSQHFGWSTPFVSTAHLTRKGVFRYFTGWFRDRESDQPSGAAQQVGRLLYSSGSEAEITVPDNDNPNFQVQIVGQQNVPGIFLPSHRPVYSYKRVDQIPTELDARDQLFEQYLTNLRQFYSANARIESPSYRLKASLISLGTFGYGNEVVERNDEAIATFEGFQRILQKVLPPQLGFQRLAIRMPDVVFECRDQEFSLDAASGGVAAIVDVAWQIYMKSLLEPEGFAVLADEPENHLHPELQRSLLPGLGNAFPQVQFVVATHNPFMVTSVPESHVFVLEFDEGRVVSRGLPDADRSASANKVLMDVLGVPFPMPLWVETKVSEIVDRLQEQEVTTDILAEAKAELNNLGFGHLFPEVVGRLLEENEEPSQ